MADEIAIIDGCGANLASLCFALERLGLEPVVTSNQETIASAGRVILPGVGAAGFAMERLRTLGLDGLIPRLRQPVLGICLGMQLLMEFSEEDGEVSCIGVIPGRCKRFETAPDMPIPHMGWNRVTAETSNGLFSGIENGSHCYFVHSYAAPVSASTLAWSQYSSRFSAAVGNNNFFGVQFHPERSGKTGARILANFASL